MEIIKTQNITNVDREKIIEELLSNEYKNIKNIIEKTSINIKKVQDGLFQVDVEVYWEKQTYKLSTFVYQKKEVNESETWGIYSDRNNASHFNPVNSGN